MLNLIPFLVLFPYLSSFGFASSDTLTPSGSLSINRTLVSNTSQFELGFFTTNHSKNKYYLGIWYFNLGLPKSTIVWVANRDSPAWSSSVSLVIDGSGRIALSELGRSEFVYSSNHSKATNNTVLRLLDNGNLIVRDQADVAADDYLWQSFDHPIDTLLPGQKLGWVNSKTGLDAYITSWKNTNDPSSGDYSFRLDRTGSPDRFLLKGGIQRIYRTGPWVERWFGPTSTVQGTLTLNVTLYDNNQGEVYWLYTLPSEQNIKFHISLDPSGKLSASAWVPNRKAWAALFRAPKDQCDNYNECGPNGLCNASNSLMMCGCSELAFWTVVLNFSLISK